VGHFVEEKIALDNVLFRYARNFLLYVILLLVVEL
jgi:hypothetical protein